MNKSEEKLDRLRKRMVEDQLQNRGVRDPRVLAAFAAVPRHRFVPEHLLDRAYEDGPLPIGEEQTISQPYVVARMLEDLDVQPGLRVLDVGAGSGYQTALLSEMGAKVFAVERFASLAEACRQRLRGAGYANIEFRVGDGTLGWPEKAPFDRIVCGAGAPRVPESWLEQLAENGKIVLPLGDRYAQELTIVRRTGGKVQQIPDIQVRFVPLVGEQGW